MTQMMRERIVSVDPSTISDLAQRYGLTIEKCVRQYQGSRFESWCVNATSARVGGERKYLFRALDKYGHLIGFKLSNCRGTGAAYRFLRIAIKISSNYPLVGWRGGCL